MFKQFRKKLLSSFLLSAILLSVAYSESINYLSPNSAEQGKNDLEVYLYASGVNFYDTYGNSGAPSSAYFSGGGIYTSNLQIVNSSTVKFDVDIGWNTSLESRDITLTGYNWGQGWNQWSLFKQDAFTITENNDGIDYLSQDEVEQDSDYTISIFGSGWTFDNGSNPVTEVGISNGGIDILSYNVLSLNEIQVSFHVSDFAYPGYNRSLTVYTSNYNYTLQNALSITADDPMIITSVSPTEGAQGADDLTLTIDIENTNFGDYYYNGEWVDEDGKINNVYFSNSDLKVVNRSIIDSNTVEINVDIDPWTDLGYYSLTLSMMGNGSGEQSEYDTFSGFEVTQSSHNLLSISPNSSYRDVQNLIITLQGENTNWGCCGTPQLQFEGANGIYVDWVSVNNSEQLTAQIDIESWASYGYSDVKVISGDQAAGFQNGFHVKSPEATLSPSVGYPGDAFEVSLIGGGVSFNDIYGTQNVSFSGSNLNISNINQTSDNTMTFYLQVGDAEPGMRDLYIDQGWYNMNYFFDDVFEVLAVGCMDGLATNYNSEAVEDDGSCNYPAFSPYTHLEISNSLVDSKYNIQYTISQDNGESIIQSGSLDSDYGTFNINNLSVGDIIGNGTFIQKPLDLDTTFIEYQVEVAQNPDSNHVNVYTRVISSNDNEFPVGLIFGGYILTNKYPGINMYAESPSPYERTSYFTSTLNLNDLFTNPSFNNIAFSANLTSLEGDTYSEEFYYNEIPGCNDPTACNFNESATYNDGSCLELDICGVCGVFMDNCGVCGGNNACFQFEKDYLFTNCGASGQFGPTQNQCQDAYNGTNLEVTIETSNYYDSYTGNNGGYSGIQIWTVPETGTYTIEAKGADGGRTTYYGSQGGEGATMKGDFNLNKGNQIKILVGQAGGGGDYASGGAGGTFVVELGITPLLIAGGGGGVKYNYDNYSEFGITSETGNWDSQYNYSGGSNGYGGNSYYYGGGSGGGLIGDGAGSYAADGGLAFINGGFGGAYGGGGSANGSGGFGGGGGGYSGGGGGGGYSGGGAGQYSGGGGGSYNSGQNQTNTDGSNNGNENHGYVSISANFEMYTNYLYSEDTQVESGTLAEVPIKLNVSDNNFIDGITFSVQISSNDADSLVENLGIQSILPGSNALITQTGNGQASIILSSLGSITNEDSNVANLLVPIPSNMINGDILTLNITSVSGSSADYEYVPLQGYYNTILSVIEGSITISGLDDDVYILENSETILDYTVSDQSGTGISMELTQAPQYVSLEFDSLSNSGTIMIDPAFGDESGLVIVSATNAEQTPEVQDISFYVNINHYPVLSPSDNVYIQDFENTSLVVTITDIDGDSLSLTLESSPDYVSYTPYNNTAGLIEINPYNGAQTGSVIFMISDGGNPQAVTTSGFDVIINYAPQIVGFGNFNVPENTVLDTLIMFYDPNNDPLTVEIETTNFSDPNSSSSYISYSIYGDNEGVLLSIAPNLDDLSGDQISLSITDPGNLSSSASSTIAIYETFLSADVRPLQSDQNNDGDSYDVGEFGDDLVVAPDVINALQISTNAPGVEIPSFGSNLFNAFDVNPIDIDLNFDGDVYDQGERGGDGYIEAADVIIALKRATTAPGYPNIRRVDIDYPHNTSIVDTSRVLANRSTPTDILLFGNIEGASPGSDISIPVTLRRGEGDLNLTGLISGFSITVSNEEALELANELQFTLQINGNSLIIPSGNEFLSLLLMDLDDLAPNTEIQIGTLDFKVPYSASIGDMYYISSQGTSGSSSDYFPITFNESSATISIEEQLEIMNTGLMHSGANLKSFYILPEDASIENMFDTENNNIFTVIGEGEAAYYLENVGWIGSLEEIHPDKGYWLAIQDELDLSISGYITDPNIEYSLNEGVNLISFPSTGSIEISDGIPDDLENQFMGIFGEGVATINLGDTWIGSLTHFVSTKGYWIQVQSDLVFSYDLTNLTENLTRLDEQEAKAPLDYTYNQSTKQAFYFIEYVNTIRPGDWLLAYHNNNVIGARQWQGDIIDVPVMGSDDLDYTLGYIENGSVPEFKLLQNNTLIDLVGDIPIWQDNQLFMVPNLRPLPIEFSLSPAYPNPFNPTTTLNFALPMQSDVIISIYNLQGREIASLLNSNMKAGYHSVVWNADNNSSGVYFVKMLAEDFSTTQKIMLIK